MRFGPDVEWIGSEDYTLMRRGRRSMSACAAIGRPARQLAVPTLPGSGRRSPAGRAQADFVIDAPEHHGVRGWCCSLHRVARPDILAVTRRGSHRLSVELSALVVECGRVRQDIGEFECEIQEKRCGRHSVHQSGDARQAPSYTHVVEVVAPAAPSTLSGQLGIDLEGRVVGDFGHKPCRCSRISKPRSLRSTDFRGCVKLNSYLADHAGAARGARALSQRQGVAGLDHDRSIRLRASGALLEIERWRCCRSRRKAR